MKKKVLLFARSFLAEYYSDIQSDMIEPIFVTLTVEEKHYLENKGWRVFGCFEEEFDNLPVANYPGNYLKTSFASDRFLNRFPLEKRCEILGKEISFWERIFNTTTPVAVFNETVAVEIAEVMAIEAEKRNIPFYSALLGFLPNTFYWKPDPFSGRLNDLSLITPSERDFEKADEYIASVTKKYHVPFYVKSYVGKRDLSMIRFFWTLFRGVYKYFKDCFVEDKKHFIYSFYRQYYFNYPFYYLRALRYKYDSLDSIRNKDFIYIPLHIEPEATLYYFIEENYRQEFFVDQVLKSVKPNQYVVVKEHPQQAGLLLEPRFRNLKKQYSNLIYLPSYITNFKVMPLSTAVVTLTSSAAWEALMMRKPVFVLGKIFYDQCPGAIRIPSFRMLKEALRKEDYIKPTPNEIRTFTARMISILHKGCPTPTVKESGINDYVESMESLLR